MIIKNTDIDRKRILILKVNNDLHYTISVYHMLQCSIYDTPNVVKTLACFDALGTPVDNFSHLLEGYISERNIVYITGECVNDVFPFAVRLALYMAIYKNQHVQPDTVIMFYNDRMLKEYTKLAEQGYLVYPENWKTSKLTVSGLCDFVYKNKIVPME